MSSSRSSGVTTMRVLLSTVSKRRSALLAARSAIVRDLLDEVLSRANYPIREVEALSESEDQVELAATLVPTTADPTELDQVVTELEGSSLVRSATWTVGTTV